MVEIGDERGEFCLSKSLECGYVFCRDDQGIVVGIGIDLRVSYALDNVVDVSYEEGR